jgi:hypothetical protein
MRPSGKQRDAHRSATKMMAQDAFSAISAVEITGPSG